MRVAIGRASCRLASYGPGNESLNSRYLAHILRCHQYLSYIRYHVGGTITEIRVRKPVGMLGADIPIELQDQRLLDPLYEAGALG